MQHTIDSNKDPFNIHNSPYPSGKILVTGRFIDGKMTLINTLIREDLLEIRQC